MASDEIEDEGGSSGVRSPRYPAMPLRDAVAKVKSVYDADKTAGTPIASAIKHMGYKGRSGPSTAALAALKRFGLVEKRGARLFPSQRAVAILCLPEFDPRRKKALVEAAIAPEIYRSLIDKYRGTGLPSASSLEHELILENKFNHNAISGFVKDFLDSLKYAGLTDENGVLLTQSLPDVDSDSDDDDGGLPLPPSSMTPVVGSHVVWLSNGKYHYKGAKQLISISKDGKWGFVEGIEDGIPMDDLFVDRDLAGVIAPPKNPHFKPGAAARSENPGMKEDVFSLDEGPVTLQWPERISKTSAQDLQDWLDLIGRKIKRATEPTQKPADDSTG